MSYPAVYVWQVSRQIPTRLLSFTRSMIYLNCQNSLPKLLPLPRSIFNNGRYSFSLLQSQVDTFCNECETILYGDFIQMAAGMEIEKFQS